MNDNNFLDSVRLNRIMFRQIFENRHMIGKCCNFVARVLNSVIHLVVCPKIKSLFFHYFFHLTSTIYSYSWHRSTHFYKVSTSHTSSTQPNSWLYLTYVLLGIIKLNKTHKWIIQLSVYLLSARLPQCFYFLIISNYNSKNSLIFFATVRKNIYYSNIFFFPFWLTRIFFWFRSVKLKKKILSIYLSSLIKKKYF